MRPPLFLMLAVVTVGIASAVVCAVCAAKANEVAAYMRDRHSRSPKWLRNWPFYSLVTKQWFPMYLGVVGAFGFIAALIWLDMVIHSFSK